MLSRSKLFYAASASPARFLDIVENFTVFEEVRGGLVKKVAKNHQYLGVNRAIRAVREIENNEGRLGVFWHTQGSGKSLSMVFFTQKILRKIPGNWTFAIVTDRDELDGQIYKTFVNTGAITVKHLAFTHCGELNHFGMVDAQIAVAECELLATCHRL